MKILKKKSHLPEPRSSLGNVKRFGVISESYVTLAIESEECRIGALDGPLELRNQSIDNCGFLGFLHCF